MVSHGTHESPGHHYQLLPILAIVLMLLGLIVPFPSDWLAGPYCLCLGVAVTFLALIFERHLDGPGGRYRPRERRPEEAKAIASPPFQFRLAHLLLGIAVVAFFLGTALQHGPKVVPGLMIATTVPLGYAIRILHHWKPLTAFRRRYAMLTLLAASLLVVLDLAFLSPGPSLEWRLHRAPRFATLQVSYEFHSYAPSLHIRGEVDSEADFQLLRNQVTLYSGFDEVVWDVTVRSSQKKHTGWDMLPTGNSRPYE